MKKKKKKNMLENMLELRNSLVGDSEASAVGPVPLRAHAPDERVARAKTLQGPITAGGEGCYMSDGPGAISLVDAVDGPVRIQIQPRGTGAAVAVGSHFCQRVAVGSLLQVKRRD